MRGASNPDGRTAALDCFASLAMTDRELAHLFLRVALCPAASCPAVGEQAEQTIAIGLDATGVTIPATESRLNLAVNRKARHPAHGASDANPETPAPRCVTGGGWRGARD
jgi:hypothetical protein